MSNQSDVTRTRVITPRRRGDLITRPRLITLLTELVEKRLVFVTAPAGYGKTSLLLDFANKSPMPVCWYSIDRTDKDLQYFIRYIVAAIQQRFAGFGQKTLSAISGDQNTLDTETIATILINDLYENVSEHFILVLDDFHLVKDIKDINRFISRILVDLEENCHVIIASRTLLPLDDITLLTARSMVGGISFEELSFLPEEIQQLYSQNYHLNLTSREAETILDRTEGWVTGVILVSHLDPDGEAARRRLSRVTDHGLEEYFHMMIKEYSEEMRSFLIWTSLMEDFTLESCEKVLQPALQLKDPKWQEWMRFVQQEILFVMQVGESRVTLRYHHLFREFLQNLAVCSHPLEARAIQYRLAEYYLTLREWDRAFSIYRLLDARDELIQMTESNGPDLLLSGRVATLSSWLDVLPREILDSRPFIIAVQGIVAMKSGDTTLAMALYNQAITGMRISDDQEHLPRTLALRANLQRLLGKLDNAILDCNECLRLIDGKPGTAKVEADVLRCLSICRYQQGKLQEALDMQRKALATAQSIHDEETCAIIQLEIGFIHESLGNYRLARSNYIQARDHWLKEKNLMWLSNLYNNLGVLEQLVGNYESAIDSFEQGIEHSRASGYTRVEAYLLTGIADMYAELQADEQAEQAYEKAAAIALHTQEQYLQVYINVKSAVLAGLRGDFKRGYQQIENSRQSINPQESELQYHLCEMEFAGMRIMENCALDVIKPLEEACAYFAREGHKVLCDKTHLLLVLAYQQTRQAERLINHMLYITTQLESEYPPVALIALAARFKKIFVECKVDHLQPAIDLLLDNINTYLEKLPAIYQYLVKHTRVIPFTPPTLVIRALGRMQVQINNHLITSSEWQTQFARDMFFMLLANPEGMTKEEISLILWPEASEEEAKFRFKNTAYRLRRAVGKNRIILEQNIYRFNNTLDYSYDVELFLKEYALASNIEDPLQKLVHYREAIKHYRGSYLSEIYNTWVDEHRENLRLINLNILLKVAEIYYQQSEYELAQEYCQRLLKEDNLLEEAYQLSFRIFEATGNQVGLIRMYKQCEEIFMKEINAPPSRKTQAVYKDLLH
jgi:ATP/maltotriose-dependent transcriptional regulator MalT/DNA-binding SARP family transcriptional activator